MIARYATREDLIEWFGEVPGTVRAAVLEHEGKIVAVAGVMNGIDHCQAFSDYKPESSKIGRAKLAILFKSILRQYETVTAFCSEKESTAPSLLTSLGFQKIEGQIWRHHAVCSAS